MINQTDRIELEAIIDRSSLKQVLDAIATIAHEKAEHIRENWQDRVTAQPWNTAGNELKRTAVRLSKIGV